MVFWGLPHYWGYNGDIQVDSGYDTGINDIYIYINYSETDVILERYENILHVLISYMVTIFWIFHIKTIISGIKKGPLKRSFTTPVEDHPWML
jgi:hypothetical protein